MSNTITLPTTDGVKEFDLMNVKNCVAIGDEKTGPLRMFNKDPWLLSAEERAKEYVATIEGIPFDVLKALIDAAQHPVCPACGGDIHVVNYVPGMGYYDDELKAKCFGCSCIGFTINTLLLPSWLDPDLAAIAALRSPRVMWQWLESLKHD